MFCRCSRKRVPFRFAHACMDGAQPRTISSSYVHLHAHAQARFSQRICGAFPAPAAGMAQIEAQDGQNPQNRLKGSFDTGQVVLILSYLFLITHSSPVLILAATHMLLRGNLLLRVRWIRGSKSCPHPDPYVHMPPLLLLGHLLCKVLVIAPSALLVHLVLPTAVTITLHCAPTYLQRG